jgi:hypothetical protein
VRLPSLDRPFPAVQHQARSRRQVKDRPACHRRTPAVGAGHRRAVGQRQGKVHPDPAVPEQVQELRPGHRLAAASRGKLAERRLPLPGRGQQSRAEPERIRQPAPLRGESVQRRPGVLPPSGRDPVMPPAGQRHLGRCRERLQVLVLDQRLRTDVQQPCRPRRLHEEIRCVDPPPGRIEPQPERLRDHVNDIRREVQGQQDPGLFRALGTMMAAGAGHERQAWPVPLASLPGKPADRIAPQRRLPDQVPHRAGLLASARSPRHRPPAGPVPVQPQAPPAARGRNRDEEILPAAPV